MPIEVTDIIVQEREPRPLLLLLSDGSHVHTFGGDISQAVMVLEFVLPENVHVIGVFDGNTMFEVEWND